MAPQKLNNAVTKRADLRASFVSNATLKFGAPRRCKHCLSRTNNAKDSPLIRQALLANQLGFKLPQSTA